MTTCGSILKEAVSASERPTCQADLIEHLRRLLACWRPCGYYLQDIRIEERRGVVTLHGRVPTDAMRSLLESTLSRIEGVKLIENRVSVISSTGLSRVFRT